MTKINPPFSSSMQNPKSSNFTKDTELRAKEISAQLIWPILIKVMICVVPAMGLVGLGKLFAGGKVFFVFLLIFLAYYVVSGKPLSFFALSISVLPVLVFLRDGLFYNSVIAILGLGLALRLFKTPQKFFQLWNNLLLRWLLVVGVLYWGGAFILTGGYSSGLMILELGFSAGIVYLLAEQRRFLSTAFIGAGISLFAIGLALLGYGSPRLVEAKIEGVTFGNPINFGIPAAFILLYSMVDDGKWLFLHKSAISRRLVGGTALIFLLLSTSRGSWAVACVGVIIMLLFSKVRMKMRILISLMIMAIFLFSLLLTEKGALINEWFDKATSDERSLEQKTTGRFDMWKLFPNVLKDSPIWGFGPGSGPEVYATYSMSDPNVHFKPGVKLAWHSLYLHIGVETGLIGLLLLTVFLASLISKGLVHRRVTGEVGPLLGVPCFMTIGLSVSALDPLSGLFLGIAFLGNTRAPRVRRPKVWRTQTHRVKTDNPTNFSNSEGKTFFQ
ncbi:O-antigen ligase family protein [Candidatus Nitrospira allomarina]|uniref:O-antigen ligase family protein n=1 Tax=Candidatus Nitrospira allomarina TaxID=3020900 RepID=A0AA96GDS7_9BACT|nr:O-antigen ligase family protein [Candidatus Nitrospira allomarina]WNM58130.1 O-antigen ligase family protein [Candidatus Nitrospira allomarina]